MNTESEIGAAVATATYVLAKLSAKPLSELGEILADRVRFWRWKNQIEILMRAGEYARKNGIEISPLKLKTLLPLLDGASLEEDPPIQEMWARLLVNAGKAPVVPITTNVAIDFLRGISSQDATVMNGLIDAVIAVHQKNIETEERVWGLTHSEGIKFNPFVHFSKERLLEVTKLDLEALIYSCDNISRYRIIEESTNHDEDGRPLSRRNYGFTRLGWDVACLLREWPDSGPEFK